MDQGLLILRCVLGVIMVFHGTEKLFGWWGGEGLDGAAAFFGRQGFHPPRLMALVAGVTESTAGILMVLGLLTPLAALMLIGTLVNVVALHLPNGLSRKANGFEYELMLLASACCLAFTGPGGLALDGWLGLDLATPAWGAAILAVGAVSGVTVVATRSRPVQLHG